MKYHNYHRSSMGIDNYFEPRTTGHVYASNGASALVHTHIILKFKGPGRIQDVTID